VTILFPTDTKITDNKFHVVFLKKQLPKVSEPYILQYTLFSSKLTLESSNGIFSLLSPS